MKTYLGISVKQIKKQKLTSIFLIIAIILSTTLLTGVAQSAGIIKSLLTNQSRWVNGDRHVSLNFINKDIANDVSKNNSIYNIGINKFFAESNIPNSSFILQLDEYDEGTLEIFKTKTSLISGAYPKSFNEIALSEDILEMLNLEKNLNQKINLNLKLKSFNGIEETLNVDFILTGILKNNSIGYISQRMQGIVGNGASETFISNSNNYSISFKIKNLKEFDDIINSLKTEFNLEENQIQYNTMYLSNLDVKSKNLENVKNDIGLNVAIIIIGLLIIISAGFVVYNIFSIAISKEVKQFGIFKAIGATSKQIYKIVIFKIIHLLVIAIPIGSILGIFLSESITKIISGLFNPNIFMLDTKEEVINLISTNSGLYLGYIFISLIVVIVASFLAAIPTAKMACRTSPKIAINDIQINKLDKIIRKKRINKNLNNIKNIGLYVARLNLNRNKSRTVITIISMFLSVVVFISLSSFLSNLDLSKKYTGEEKGDFLLSTYDNKIGFDKRIVEKISNIQNVNDIMYIKHSFYNKSEIQNDINFAMNNGFISIEGINDSYFKFIVSDLTKDEKEMLKNGTGCLIGENTDFVPEGFEKTVINKGDVITLNNKKLNVIKIVPGLDINNALGTVEIILNENVYENITKDNTIKKAYIHANKNSDLQKIEQEINFLTSDIPSSTLISYEKLRIENLESFKQISFLAICFIIFINIITFINVFNTIYVNIQSRLKEIGIQRAIGISKKSLYKIFILEGIYMCSIASVFGVIFGIIISVFLNIATNQSSIFSISIYSIITSVLIIFLICIISIILCLYKIKNISVIENIKI